MMKEYIEHFKSREIVVIEGQLPFHALSNFPFVAMRENLFT